jgi:hypothetical protein
VNTSGYKAKGIKVADQLTLRSGEHAGLSGWAQCNRKSVYECKRKAEKRTREIISRSCNRKGKILLDSPKRNVSHILFSFISFLSAAIFFKNKI